MYFRVMYSNDHEGGETMVRITKIDTKNFVIPRKLRVAAYARVSTSTDDQLQSLAIQKQHYEGLIKDCPNWEFAGLYYDEGITGTKVEKREGLLNLLKDCKEGKVDKVITKSISRFSRNTTNTLDMVRKLSKCGVFIYFEKENIDTEHMDSELMLSILSSIAESESRSISQNAKWSIKSRFETGTYIISKPPYGYENVDGKMVIVPNEAMIVKEIFTRALNGEGSHVIAKELNDRGIPSKKGVKWHASSIQEILKNEKYMGDALFQKTFTDDNFNRHMNYGERNMYLVKDHHPAIITHEVFEQAAICMHMRGSQKGQVSGINKYQNRYAFSGKIICGQCGSTFKRRCHSKPSGNYIAWTCNGHLQDKSKCSMLYVKDEDLKQAFIKMMNKLQYGHSKIIKPFITGLRCDGDNTKVLETKKLEQRLLSNLEQQNALASLMNTGYIEPDVYYSELSILTQEMNSINNEKQTLSQSINSDFTNIREAEKLSSFLMKHKIMQEFNPDVFLEFVEKIEVIDRKTFTFKIKCGLNLTERVK